MRSKPIQKHIKVSNYKFMLEIYPNLESNQEISWEIFPHDYHAALYAFSNKEKLNKIIQKKHIYEPRKNI